MATPAKFGTGVPLLQTEEWDYDPQRGYVHRLHVYGASPNQMWLLQQTYANQGIACRLTYAKGGAATLTIDDATQTFTLDTWQILGNDEGRDNLSHPTVLGLASDEQIALIRQYLADDEYPDVAFADPALSTLAGGAVQRFYVLNQRGTTEYRKGQYVLRHTTNVSNRWTSNVSDFNVEKIYPTSTLISECQNGALWINPMPGRLAYKIAAIPEPTYRSGYFFGWLKGASTEVTAANNRVDIVTEFILEQWSTDQYGIY